ncbi:hypothetical protein RI367_007793 [Sorochytrium milnesiophthora]
MVMDDDHERTLPQKEEFQTLANEDPEQFQELVDFAKEPMWMKMIYFWRRQQQLQTRLQTMQDALVYLPGSAGARAGEFLFQLSNAVQEDIKTLVHVLYGVATPQPVLGGAVYDAGNHAGP